MTKDALVNEDFAAKFVTEKDSPYTRWVAEEGLDIIAAHYVPDLRTVELKPWERRGGRAWAVNDKVFAWEREFRKADIKRYGDQTPPEGPILAVRTADLGEKEAMLAAGHDGFFTIPHFDGYPGLLIQLRAVRRPALREALVDAWLAVAPRALAEQYLNSRRRRR